MRTLTLIATLALLSISQQASAQMGDGVYTVRQLPTIPTQPTVHIPNGR